MRVFYPLRTVVALCLSAASLRADTAITFTRTEVDQMANFWETDCLSISPLADTQYPIYTTNWQFIFPHSSISGDGDVHIDMAVDSSGTGQTGNNTGASPIVSEVINANSSHVNALASRSARQSIFRGIFRLYTEHAGERHFELHPVTQLLSYNGANFVADLDYHANIIADANGTTHATSTLTGLLDGSQKVTATASANNTSIAFTFPSPSVNYVQYDGVALTAVQSDALSQYFLFQPTLVSGATVRCRLVANTAVVSSLSALAANQSLTVNALTRTDMATVSSQISSLNGGQAKTFPRPVEFITLGVSNLGPAPTPTPTPGGTTTVTTLTNANVITISGSNSGRGQPYPATIVASGVPGKISKVTARLNSIKEASNADFSQDIDIMMTNPAGQAVMLMSDAGGGGKLNTVTLTFDDFAAAMLPQTTIVSGTYKPTNYQDDADAFPAPAPAGTPASALSIYNSSIPNGTWSLFVLDEYAPGAGSIVGGWTLSLETQPAAPVVITTAASVIRSTSAVLNGSINALGQLTTSQFQLGTDTNYTFTQSVQNAGNGTAATPVSLVLAGLQPATTYHFRVIATNATGTTNGNDLTFTTATATDSDNDGMPSDYETDNSFDPNNAADAALDDDGDGLTNLQEYRAGTNPHSASSDLRISSIDHTGEDLVITFPSVFGKLYRVEWTDTPGGTPNTLQDNIAGTSAAIVVNDTEAADLHPRRFYRVRVLP